MVLVDTNILAYLMIEGIRTAEAQRLFDRDPDWRSEAFIMVELSNILTTHVRTGALTRERALRLLAEASVLIPAQTSVPHARALEAANDYGISAYDGRFIALARQMRRPLVTEDAKLRAVAPEWTVSLGDAVRS